MAQLRIVVARPCVPLSNDWKVKPALQLAPSAPRRSVSRAALSLVLGAVACACHTAYAQQSDTQQTPAPVIRVRPRTQTGVPVTAPSDAAPLVNHAPRPRPVNPQILTGATGVTAPAQPARSQAAAPSAEASHTGAAGHTGTATLRPRPLASAAAGRTGPSGATGTATRIRPLTQPATGSTGATTSTATAATSATAPPKPSTTGLNRNVIVLDPAHGGTDSGSRIGDSTLEKNVTLSLAFRLRSLLIARGFTVVLTRDSDAATQANAPNNPLTLDDRAGVANHMRAAACLLLHATGRGDGVHLYSSELEAATGETPDLPWLTAQAPWIPASQQLEHSISSALGRSHISLVSSTASIRPVDSLTCPALVLELAPETGDPKTVNDAGYQDRVAAAVAGALVFWENQVQAPPKLSLSPQTTHSAHRHTASASGERHP